jgi:hypothetical protein
VLSNNLQNTYSQIHRVRVFNQEVEVARNDAKRIVLNTPYDEQNRKYYNYCLYYYQIARALDLKIKVIINIYLYKF